MKGATILSELPASKEPWRIMEAPDGSIIAINPLHRPRRIKDGIVSVLEPIYASKLNERKKD